MDFLDDQLRIFVAEGKVDYYFSTGSNRKEGLYDQ
jgi:hypothetical protein